MPIDVSMRRLEFSESQQCFHLAFGDEEVDDEWTVISEVNEGRYEDKKKFSHHIMSMIADKFYTTHEVMEAWRWWNTDDDE